VICKTQIETLQIQELIKNLEPPNYPWFARFFIAQLILHCVPHSDLATAAASLVSTMASDQAKLRKLTDRMAEPESGSSNRNTSANKYYGNNTHGSARNGTTYYTRRNERYAAKEVRPKEKKFQKISHLLYLILIYWQEYDIKVNLLSDNGNFLW